MALQARVDALIAENESNVHEWWLNNVHEYTLKDEREMTDAR